MSDSVFVPNHALVGDPAAPRVAFVLHGILGNLRNWRFYARDLAEALPDWRFLLVDLRNHGESTGAPEPHTLDACAADLERLADTLGIAPEAVIGHSFGGKVALTYLARRRVDRPSRALRQVWVLDAMPDRVDRSTAALTSDVIRVIAGLREVALPLERRRDVVPALEALGFSGTLARWMTTNLTQSPDRDGYVWSFDLDAVELMLDDYLATDLWPVLERLEPGDPEVHVVRALESPRWPAETVARLRALGPDRVRLHDLADSGHWVHVDNPTGLSQLLVAGLGEVSG